MGAVLESGDLMDRELATHGQDARNKLQLELRRIAFSRRVAEVTSLRR
jgi:hypothetical protein